MPRSLFRGWFAFLVLCSLSGCAIAPLKGPLAYSDGQIAFQVPSDWRLTLRGQDKAGSYAFIESPGDAVVFIQGMSKADDPGIEEYAELYARRSLPNLPHIRFTFPQRSKFSRAKYDRALREEFAVAGLDEEIPHTRTFQSRTVGDQVYYVVTQSADADTSVVKSGFSEILKSFRATNGLAPAP